MHDAVAFGCKGGASLTIQMVELADQMPMKIEFVESAERVEEVLPKLTEIAAHGLIEVQDTMVINPATDKKHSQPPPAIAKPAIVLGENR